MIPHHDDDEIHAEVGDHGHTVTMWKGLAVMLGIVFFFFTEKVLNLGSEWRKRRQRNRKVNDALSVNKHHVRPFTLIFNFTAGSGTFPRSNTQRKRRKQFGRGKTMQAQIQFLSLLLSGHQKQQGRTRT